MEAKIVTKKELKLIGKKVVAPVSNLGKEVPQAQNIVRTSEIPFRIEPKGIMGIGSVRDIVEDTEIHTIYIGSEVSHITEVPKGFEELTIPEQKYVSYTYMGPMVDCWKVYGELFNWIEKSGYQINLDSYSIEHYDENHNWDDKHTHDNHLHIYIPIQ
ncbi:GyrI-like domain-containing protein [Bacillus salitolerans]|uniref:GyrI-like domain-containing protein n=1 Tax=Bacillus salitolerans TaxID=1437434 RepID=A0ABW4LVC6_9BACI